MHVLIGFLMIHYFFVVDGQGINRSLLFVASKVENNHHCYNYKSSSSTCSKVHKEK